MTSIYTIPAGTFLAIGCTVCGETIDVDHLDTASTTLHFRVSRAVTHLCHYNMCTCDEDTRRVVVFTDDTAAPITGALTHRPHPTGGAWGFAEGVPLANYVAFLTSEHEYHSAVIRRQIRAALADEA